MGSDTDKVRRSEAPSVMGEDSSPWGPAQYHAESPDTLDATEEAHASIARRLWIAVLTCLKAIPPVEASCCACLPCCLDTNFRLLLNSFAVPASNPLQAPLLRSGMHMDGEREAIYSGSVMMNVILHSRQVYKRHMTCSENLVYTG